MNILSVDTGVNRLVADSGFIHLHSDNHNYKISASLIEGLVVHDHCSIEIRTLLELQKKNISLSLFSYKDMFTMTNLLPNGKNCIRRYQQYEAFNSSTKNELSKQIITTKIARQIRTLEKLLQLKKVHIQKYIKNLGSINQKIVSSQDIHANQLLGYEGTASRIYFEAMAKWYPKSLGFAGRNYRPCTDPVNSVLSFYYSLVYKLAANIAIQSSLDPMLGFLHRPTYNRYSLACDIMEPLRPTIDLLVAEMFLDKYFQKNHFDVTQDGCYMNSQARVKVFKSFNANKKLYKRYIHLHCIEISKIVSKHKLR